MANEKRLIDASALVDKLEGLKSVLYGWEDYNTGIDSAVYQAENAPTVDAVEVVRCKDCKHWSDGVAGCTDHVKCCKIGFYMVGENGYCVYGERRTDG